MTGKLSQQTAGANTPVDSRFANPRKLGFMRLIEVLFVVEIVLIMVALVFVRKEQVPLGAQDYAFFITLLLKSAAVWLIESRKKVVRYFIPAVCLIEMGIDFFFFVLVDGMGFFDYITMEIGLIVVAVYTLTSRRMKAVMTQPFNDITKEETLESEHSFWNPRKLVFWRNMIIYFCVFSVVGHWMEAGYCTLIRFGIMPGTYDPNSQIWSDWLYPFMVYGVGFCVCGLFLFPIKMWLEKHFKGALVPLLFSFVVNIAVCALIELVLGFTQNPDLSLWDYSDMAFNFMGQICLLNSTLFGGVATVMTWLVYPAIEKLFLRLSNEGEKVVFVVVVVLYAFLYCLYYINL